MVCRCLTLVPGLATRGPPGSGGLIGPPVVWVVVIGWVCSRQAGSIATWVLFTGVVLCRIVCMRCGLDDVWLCYCCVSVSAELPGLTNGWPIPHHETVMGYRKVQKGIL